MKDEDELRRKFIKENPETIELFNKIVDEIFGKKEDDKKEISNYDKDI
ncbi:MAG: hypothetical protein ACTSQP_09710 [Promethearchaeota archaeon]